MLKHLALETTSNTLANVLSMLQASTVTFTLTGSRFFGNAHSASDYDFFISRLQAHYISLPNMGFKLIENKEMIDKGYDGNQFSAVWELTTSDDVVVQVQVVEAHGAKEFVQQRIKAEFLEEFNSMSKPTRRRLWSLLLNMS